jgi:hypothetical protein
VTPTPTATSQPTASETPGPPSDQRTGAPRLNAGGFLDSCAT